MPSLHSFYSALALAASFASGSVAGAIILECTCKHCYEVDSFEKGQCLVYR